MARSKIVVPGPGDSIPPKSSENSRGLKGRSARRPVVVPDPGGSAAPAPKTSRRHAKYVVGPGMAPKAKRAKDGTNRVARRSDARTSSKAPKKRRRSARVGLVVVVLMALIAGYYSAVAWRTNAAVKHTGPEVLAALSADPGPTNILMIGSDTRAGGNSIIPGESKAGLADVMMIVQIRGGSARILSIPRDTRVKLPGYGDQKINASMPLGGPVMAVNAVKALTGLPIHRFATIDFEGFIGVTDSVGGVELCLDNAQRDSMSGLNLAAGCQIVNGEQALAFVRSRHTQILVNGTWTTDGTGDIGRIQRQQKFLGALMNKLSTPASMTYRAWSLGPALASAFTTDPKFSAFTSAKAARAMVGGSDSMELMALPTVPATINGIAYLDPKQPEAQQVINNFRQQ